MRDMQEDKNFEIITSQTKKQETKVHSKDQIYLQEIILEETDISLTRKRF
jgi:hypothetical protein